MNRCIPVLAGAAFVLATSACNTAAGASVETGPAPALTVQQAAAVQASYDKRNNETNKAFDAAGLAQIETAPLLASSRAQLYIKRQLDQPAIPPISHDGGTFLIPAGGAGPRWFVSVATSTRGGVPSARPGYTVFSQQGAGAPWLAAYDVSPLDTVPAVQTNPAGAAAPVTDPNSLVLSPAAVNAAIFRHYTENPKTDPFGRTAALDDQLASGYRTGAQTLAARGARLTRTLASASQPTYLLRTTDGGALAFTASIVTDTIRATADAGTASLAAATNEAALAGYPNGVTGRRFAISRLQTFLTYLPTKASGQKVRVLAYTETPINVERVACKTKKCRGLRQQSVGRSDTPSTRRRAQ